MEARIQTQPDPSTAPQARGALAGLALAMGLSSLGTSIANVALPTLAEAFGAAVPQVQWVVVAYLLGVTTSIVGVGRLGDLYGRRRLLVAGLLGFGGAAAAAGLAPSLGLLVVARLAQGVSAAALMAITLAFVGELVPKARTGRAMGLLGTTSAIGTALGPSLGGALLAGLGWRAIFLIQAPIALLALVLALRFLPASSPSVAVERQRAPLVPLALLREPALAAGLAMSGLVSTVLMATLVVGPYFLTRGLGLAPGRVGLVMSAGPLVAALTALPAGRLVDQLGARRTTLAGLVGIGLGAAILAARAGAVGVGGYLAPVVLITASYALFQTANNTSVLGELGPARRGLASGLLTLSRNLGLVTGAALMGAVFAAASGHADLALASAAEVAAGLRASFGLAAALIAVALVIGAWDRVPAGRSR